jgi:polysaccharide export outer membrane protein
MRFATLALTLLLSACAALPRGAPVERAVLSSAEAGAVPALVQPVTTESLPLITTWGADAPDRWLPYRRGSAARLLLPGDVVDVVIWETGANPLLAEAGGRQARIDGLRIAPGGTIFVPYVGQLRVAGQTPEAARRLLQRRLGESAPSAQVQLRMAEGRENMVDLVAGVRAPGPLALPHRDFTVLSALAAGGGVLPELENPRVRLTRGAETYAVPLERLYADPALDTRLRGGDKLIVAPDRRRFIALGAAGRQTQVAFTRESLSALDALALAGGLAETRADPTGLQVLRSYGAGEAAPPQPRVIFTLDLTTADGLFAAGLFDIRDGDLLLATESPLSNAGSALALFGAALGLGRVVSSD